MEDIKIADFVYHEVKNELTNESNYYFKELKDDVATLSDNHYLFEAEKDGSLCKLILKDNSPLKIESKNCKLKSIRISIPALNRGRQGYKSESKVEFIIGGEEFNVYLKSQFIKEILDEIIKIHTVAGIFKTPKEYLLFCEGEKLKEELEEVKSKLQEAEMKIEAGHEKFRAMLSVLSNLNLNQK